MKKIKLEEKGNRATQRQIAERLKAGKPLAGLLAGLVSLSAAAQSSEVVGEECLGGMPPPPPEEQRMVTTEKPLPPGQYRVRKGDTLTSIAKAKETTVEELKKLNNFDDERANNIKAGEIIRVPAPKPPQKEAPATQPAATNAVNERINGGWTGGKIKVIEKREPKRPRNK